MSGHSSLRNNVVWQVLRNQTVVGLVGSASDEHYCVCSLTVSLKCITNYLQSFIFIIVELEVA
jgi:hypothetical protein